MINNTIHLSAAWIAPYVILDTDYENFSCIYSCSGYNFGYYSSLCLSPLLSFYTFISLSFYFSFHTLTPKSFS